MRAHPGKTTLCCLAVVVAVGCTRQMPPAAPATSTWTSNGYHFLIALPAPLRQLDRTVLRVRIANENGAAADRSSVTADLSMPSMPMPTNTVTLADAGHGNYEGVARFTMAGAWTVRVRAERSGTILTDHTCSVEVH